jgi:hypothetical protein
MDMKVGVLTFHRATNYGTALQAFATVAALKAMGYNAELIDYRPAYIERTVRVRRLRNAKSPKEIASILLNRMVYGHQQNDKIQRFLEFCEQFPQGSMVCETTEDVAQAARQYDAVISGSDQLWNENITGNDLTYFLPFPHPKKISFASSFGVSSISEERKSVIGPHLRDFAHWALREETAVRLTQTLVEPSDSAKLHRVVDPTLLLDADSWKQQMNAAMNLPKDGYILTYYMIETPILRAVTERLQKQTGLPVVNLKPSKRQVLCREGKNLMWAGPREFLSCYAGAKYVVTNSFHGTAFAINFQVPMYVAPLPVSMAGEVNSRLVEILDWYGLSDRWITSTAEAENMDIQCLPVSLSATIRTRREETIEILKSMLTWENNDEKTHFDCRKE